MSEYKHITNEDLATLQLSESELQLADEGIERLVGGGITEERPERPCCQSCSCSGYTRGNPSTVCGRCGHSWNAHSC